MTAPVRIDADHITFTDDGHAWWVLPLHDHPAPLGKLDAKFFRRSFDRPCVTCEGSGDVEGDHPASVDFCPADCIDGRHTFEIETRCSVCWGKRAEWCGYGFGLPDDNPNCSAGVEAHRVSIVPGMVMPIVDLPAGPQSDRQEPCVYLYGACWWAWFGRGVYGVAHMPPAAKPGMWAVKLKVTS